MGRCRPSTARWDVGQEDRGGGSRWNVDEEWRWIRCRRGVEMMDVRERTQPDPLLFLEIKENETAAAPMYQYHDAVL